MSCLRSEEGVFSGWESHSIKVVYDFDLLYDFLPPEIILVLLKRVCTLVLGVCSGCGGDSVDNLTTLTELSV